MAGLGNLFKIVRRSKIKTEIPQPRVQSTPSKQYAPSQQAEVISTETIPKSGGNLVTYRQSGFGNYRGGTILGQPQMVRGGRGNQNQRSANTGNPTPSTGRPVSTGGEEAAKKTSFLSKAKSAAGKIGLATASTAAGFGVWTGLQAAVDYFNGGGGTDPITPTPQTDPTPYYNSGFLDGIKYLLGGSGSGDYGSGGSGYYTDGSEGESGSGSIIDTISDYLPYIIVGIVIIGIIALLSGKKGGKNMARKKSKTGRKTRTHRRSRK